MSLRERRRQATIDEILAAAWALVRAEGLAALSMRELGHRVGLGASSLYQYFASKLDIYDAMFAQGHRELHDHMVDLDREGDPVEVFRHGSRLFTEFCLDDPVRFQLLFQRTIPDFVPSADSMAEAWTSFGDLRGRLDDVGVSSPAAVDLWTAMHMGLISQQLSNDPGGDRWTRLLDDAIDMYLAHAGVRRKGKRR